MLNNNNPAIRYQYSTNEPEIKFCETNPINSVLLNNSHYSGLSWKDICSKITNINQEIFFDNISAIPEVKLIKAENKNENKSNFSCYIGNPSTCFKKHKFLNTPIKKLHQKINSKTCRLGKSRISTLKLKSLISNKNMNFLPPEIQQNLIQLMPECDQILEEHEKSNNHLFSLSNTSLNNEFFNKALSNFLLKVTNHKPMISIESFINNIKSNSKKVHSDILSIKKSKNFAYSSLVNDKSSSFSSQEMMTLQLDYDFNIGLDKISKSDIEFSTSFINNQINCDRKIQVNQTKEEKYIFGNSFTKSLKYDSEVNDFSNIVKEKESVEFYNNRNNINLPFSSEIIDSSKSNKYKRRNSGSAIAPTPNKRPTRSTAGQLPARLKSTSPPPTIQNTNSQFTHLSLINKSVSIRSKNKEKRKSKSNDSFRNSFIRIKESKPSSMNCDTILFNLRNKLSKRLQKNSQKYFGDAFSADESILNVSPDINSFHSKSPSSLSPGSDKLSFVNSPSSKNGQNHSRHSKLKNSFYENQAPISPQWSFSSEFTSQSSVESVLSQKNIRLEQEDMNGIDNLLEDVDNEEMPPPRRTLTVAAMREKMRAKKMAKEGKRKDIDKDGLLDLDTMSLNKIMDLAMKQSHSSTMSTMMSMTQENPSDETDDENLPNEFDSFLIDDSEIDDYHVEIDDKILNYSDDLDDLLLTGGNESLLEIIMKDPDAMEIANENFCSLNSENQIPNTISSHLNYNPNDSKNFPCILDSNIPHSNAFNSSNSNIIDTTSDNVEKSSISDSSFIKVDNPILLSQTLTSVIQKVSNNIQNSKDVPNIKGSLPNAYLVDGNGLSDALKLIQSLNPGAKVTTQQFYLVNSGPQLILCQTPPTQACSTRPVNSKSPIKSVMNTTHIASSTSSAIITPFIRNISNNNCNVNNTIHNLSNSNIATNVKPSVTSNQGSILSSTISVLPQFSAFNSKTQNIYSVNSNFSNKIITPVANLCCKLNNNNVQHTTTISSAGTNVLQQSTIFGNQKSITTNSSSNGLGIRLQLAQNFQHSQPVSILQSGQNSVIPTLMNQQLQFLSPQPNSNISLITQPQPLSKLVLLCPNLNCQPMSSDINNSLKTDSQQLIFVSPQKEQSNPISLATNPTFQVLNGPNFWQQINPNFGTIFGSANPNNLVLMNPQTLNNQPFSFNYQPQSQIITANNLVIMSSNNFNQSSQLNNQKTNTHQSKIFSNVPSTSLTIAVNNKNDEDNLINVTTQSATVNLNSNSSQNSCVELLSNSSSSANSKLSFDDKSSCQLSKSYSENLTDSDQEKSINSPQFQLLTSDLSTQIISTESDSFLSVQLADKCKHLTVDIDSLSPSNSVFQNKISIKSTENCLSTSSQNDDSNIIQSPGTDYDQSDFEIPCVYSEKIQIRQISLINENDNRKNDICDS